MSWLETNPVMERMKFIVALDRGEETMTALCRRFGISRDTGYFWKRRFEEGGVHALEDRPSYAKSHPNAIADDLADQIVLLRKAHPSWGPKKLQAALARELPANALLPATSTFGEVLKRRGMISPRKRRMRVPPLHTPLADYCGPNSIWCLDHKGHFPLDDKSRCYPLTMMDGASRYLFRCEGLRSTSEEQARPVIESAFREFGLPLRIRSDNGSPFATRSIGGLSRLSVWWVKLGIDVERIEPGHPEQNGRLERFHRTLEEAIGKERCSMAVQQRKFDGFRGEYNHDRPHEALGQATPASVYETSWRPYPGVVGSPEYPDDTLVRRVDGSGKIAWKGVSLMLSKLLADEPVGLSLVEENRWDIHFGPVYLATLDTRGDEPKLRFSGPTDTPLES